MACGNPRLSIWWLLFSTSLPKPLLSVSCKDLEGLENAIRENKRFCRFWESSYWSSFTLQSSSNRAYFSSNVLKMSLYSSSILISETPPHPFTPNGRDSSISGNSFSNFSVVGLTWPPGVAPPRQRRFKSARLIGEYVQSPKRNPQKLTLGQLRKAVGW